MCLVALVSSTGFAQNSNLQDVIYLKNGSVIRGAIIEQVPGESLKIETRDGNIFVYQMDEISKMTREHNSISSYSGSNRLSAKSAGYAGSIEAGYGIGVSGYGGRFEFDVVNGYQFNPYFYLGFGIGVNVWTNGSDIVTLPFFAHLRANFMDRPVSPFFALSAGYNVSVTSDVKGGFMVEPALGVAFRTSNRNAVTLGIGYSGQRYKEEGYRYYYGYYDETLWISAIRIKVGFTF